MRCGMSWIAPIMPEKIDFIKFIKIWGTIFLLGTGVALIVVDATYTYHDFQLRAAGIRSEYIDHQRQTIKQEVMQVVDTIRYKQSRSEAITRAKIKERVFEAMAIATNIHQTNTGEVKKGSGRSNPL